MTIGQLSSNYRLYAVLFFVIVSFILLKIYFSHFHSNILNFYKVTEAKTIYAITCQNQEELDHYLNVLPSVSTDVVFYCWEVICSVPPSNQDSNYFVFNEKELGLKLTWTTTRNFLFEKILEIEKKINFRYRYFVFVDGDTILNCPVLALYQGNDKDEGTKNYWKKYFTPSFQQLFFNSIKKENSIRGSAILPEETMCYLGFNAFLITVSPAIGVGVYNLPPENELPIQMMYHVDANVNAFHRDAVELLLPYFGKYDHLSWWISQAYLVYKSICVYGHVMQFNYVILLNTDHREYPKTMGPKELFALLDDEMKNGNIAQNYPSDLHDFHNFLGFSMFIMYLGMDMYSGYSTSALPLACKEFYNITAY
eukprot:TRINITY_DN16055_c0_g1_i1.p1 TRINITY_DN16055_c0_g1~~TRINITY_DN16055_c0_g1_i1.p1  ORF type:complete len:367 (+),score=11.17 TRINITY_DN16055_c0_g1_i1:61-1161(+)